MCIWWAIQPYYKNMIWWLLEYRQYHCAHVTTSLSTPQLNRLGSERSHFLSKRLHSQNLSYVFFLISMYYHFHTMAAAQCRPYPTGINILSTKISLRFLGLQLDFLSIVVRDCSSTWAVRGQFSFQVKFWKIHEKSERHPCYRFKTHLFFWFLAVKICF